MKTTNYQEIKRAISHTITLRKQNSLYHTKTLRAKHEIDNDEFTENYRIKCYRRTQNYPQYVLENKKKENFNISYLNAQKKVWQPLPYYNRFNRLKNFYSTKDLIQMELYTIEEVKEIQFMTHYWSNPDICVSDLVTLGYAGQIVHP